MSHRYFHLTLALLAARSCAAQQPPEGPRYQSAFLRVELAADQPAFVALAVDSLGHQKLSANPLRPPAAAMVQYRSNQRDNGIEYRPAGASPSSQPVWTFEFAERSIRLTSNYSADHPPPDLLFDFDLYVARATLLGLMDANQTVRLPALLHMPLQGTLRITSPRARICGWGTTRFATPSANAKRTG